MNLQLYPDRDMLAIDLASHLAGELRNALDHKERVLLSVPGGTTPGPIFDDLCAADLDWSRVDIVLNDERWVPEDSPRSNTKLLRERLTVNRAAAATLVPLVADAPEPEGALDALSQGLGAKLPIDVLLLGMGADMHTASLFPGADNLTRALAADAPVLLPMRAPGAPEPRITITAPVLNAAIIKHIVITGEDKMAAIETASNHAFEDAPIASVMSGATIHWAP